MPLVSDSENLALECGLTPDEGVMVAFLPPLLSVMQEFHYETQDGLKTVYAQDDMVIDMLDSGQPAVKWWKVRGAASQLGLSIVEPVWSGAAADFTHDRYNWVEPPEGYSWYMRSFSRGPWIALSDTKRTTLAVEPCEEHAYNCIDDAACNEKKESNEG